MRSTMSDVQDANGGVLLPLGLCLPILLKHRGDKQSNRGLNQLTCFYSLSMLLAHALGAFDTDFSSFQEYFLSVLRL